MRANQTLSCCGHRRRFHTPVCEYWIPGTRDQIPRPCGCTALLRDPKLAADVTGEAERIDHERPGRERR